MKFTKLSPSDIKCILTRQELSEFGIDIEDIMNKSERTRDFFRNLLTRASNVLGFAGKNGFRMASAQISVLSDDTISIIFHESDMDESFLKLAGGDPQVIQQLKNSILEQLHKTGKFPELTRELKKQLLELIELQISKSEGDNAEALEQLKAMKAQLSAEHPVPDGNPAGGDNGFKSRQNNRQRSFGISFPDLDSAIDYAERCSGQPGGVSMLYRSRLNGTYYLFIMHNDMEDNAYDSMKLIANDFGSIVGEKGSERAFILENSDLVAGHDAIDALARSSGRDLIR